MAYMTSLAKPWDTRPSSIPEPGTPIDGSAIPSGLVNLVANSPPQSSMTDYKEVHLWWWVAYKALIKHMQDRGDERWKEVDKYIAQSE